MLYLSQLHRWENAVFISTSQHREAEWLGQDHTAAEWQRKDCSPGDYLQITTLLYWSMHFALGFIQSGVVESFSKVVT